MDQFQAETPGEAFWTLNPFALVNPGESWYSDIEAVFPPGRYGVIAPLQRRLTPQRGRHDFVHVGLLGQAGLGKSTQVRKALDELSGQGIEPVFVNALESLDQANLTFADVILVLSRSVLAALDEAHVEIGRAEQELVRSWFAEELLTETHRKEILGALEAEAKAAVGVGFLAKLTAKVTAVLKSDNEYRTEIRRRAERDPADLIRRANLLLDAATQAISTERRAPRTLAIAVDNLEKISDRSIVDTAILRRAEDVRLLRCHLILFLAPPDEYHPVTVRARDAFEFVPMSALPVRSRHEAADHVDPAALAAVRDLLGRRVALQRVFENPEESVREVARVSGGRLRDVFHLARLACEEADPARVTSTHLKAAARRLGAERATQVAPGQWPRLAEIHRDKQVARDPVDAYLLLHSLVLTYDDGAAWWDVHPLVRLDPRFDAAWTSVSRIATGPAPV